MQSIAMQYAVGTVDYTKFPMLSQEIIETAPVTVGSIGESKNTKRECMYMSKIAEFLMENVILPYKDKQVFHQTYNIEINEYEVDGNEVVDLSIIRKRMPPRYNRRKLEVKDKSVGNLKNPSLEARFVSGKMVLCRQFDSNNDGVVSVDHNRDYATFGSGTSTQIYNRFIKFIIGDILSRLSDTPVYIPVFKTEAQKRKEREQAKRQRAKERKEMEKQRIIEEKVRAREEKNENRRARRDDKTGRTIEVPAYVPGTRSYARNEDGTYRTWWLTPKEYVEYSQMYMTRRPENVEAGE